MKNIKNTFKTLNRFWHTSEVNIFLWPKLVALSKLLFCSTYERADMDVSGKKETLLPLPCLEPVEVRQVTFWSYNTLNQHLLKVL